MTKSRCTSKMDSTTRRMNTMLSFATNLEWVRSRSSKVDPIALAADRQACCCCFCCSIVDTFLVCTDSDMNINDKVSIEEVVVMGDIVVVVVSLFLVGSDVDVVMDAAQRRNWIRVSFEVEVNARS